jgi:hypothetical protein
MSIFKILLTKLKKVFFITNIKKCSAHISVILGECIFLIICVQLVISNPSSNNYKIIIILYTVHRPVSKNEIVLPW